MIYELREYTASPGRLPKLQARFRDHTLKLFEKHGMTNVGYWTNSVGGSSDQLVYMLAFPDEGARAKSWAAFQADPEWQKVRSESEADGVPLTHHIVNRLMTPTDYSPLK